MISGEVRLLTREKLLLQILDLKRVFDRCIVAVVVVEIEEVVFSCIWYLFCIR